MVKVRGSTPDLPCELLSSSIVEAGGIPGVAVECVEIRKNTSGEGGLLGISWHWGATAGGANRIRYPGSPRRKRWVLGVWGSDPLGAGANA